MGHHARGDSRKVAYSSEDDEGYHTRNFISATTIQRMSQLNFLDINQNIVRVSGEAPPMLISTMLDETDRQFWAEDELSSSESKKILVVKRKRRRSVAYRNRAIVHRSRSALFQSSSSNSGPVYLKMSTALCATQKQRKNRHCGGLIKKAMLERELSCLLRKSRETEALKMKK